MSSKSLNTSGGVNRLRFERISSRLRRLNVDVLHKVKPKISDKKELNDEESASTVLTCLFQDELEQRKFLDSSSQFKRFFYQVSPLVQSLPELIHHQARVIELLIEKIRSVAPEELQSFLFLASLLPRDLQDDFSSHFQSLFSSLASRAAAISRTLASRGGDVVHDSFTPEETASLFECMSHLVKHEQPRLRDTPDVLSGYYGPLLGHHISYIRDLSAKCFMIALRKTPSKVFAHHHRRLLKALSARWKSMCPDAPAATYLPVLEVEAGAADTDSCGTALSNAAAVMSFIQPQRVNDIVQGLALLQFYLCKGVRGCLHSKAESFLASLLAQLLPLDKAMTESIRSAASSDRTTKSEANGQTSGAISMSSLSESVQGVLKKASHSCDAVQFYIHGQIVTECIRSLFRHVHPSNASELWDQLIACAEQASALWTVQPLLPSSEAAIEIAKINDALYLGSSFLVELLIFGLSHSNSRALADGAVRDRIGDRLVKACLSLSASCVSASAALPGAERREHAFALVDRCLILFCRLWCSFPSSPSLLSRVGSGRSRDSLLPRFFAAKSSRPAVLIIADNLMRSLPRTIVRLHLVGQVMSELAVALSEGGSSENVRAMEIWLSVSLDVLTHISDCRDSEVSGVDSEKLFKDDVGSDYKSSGKSLRENGAQDDEWSVSSNGGNDESSGDDDDERKETLRSRIVKAFRQRSTLMFRRSDNRNDAGDVEGAATLVLDNLSSVKVIALACVNIILSTLKIKKSKSVVISSASVILASSNLCWILNFCPEVVKELKEFHTCLAQLANIIASIPARKLATTEILLGRAVLAHLVRLLSASLPLTLEQRENGNVFMSASLRNMISLFRENAQCISCMWAMLHLLSACGKAVGESPREIIIKILTQDEIDALLDTIGTALVTPSYWLRVGLLRLLQCLPEPKLISLTQAEKNQSNVKKSSKAKEVPYKTSDNTMLEESIDVATICLKAAITPCDVRSERVYAQLLSSVEVIVRGGRLPLRYTRILCAFCLGQLNVKFMPAWEPAILVIVSIVNQKDGDDILWPLLIHVIQQLSLKSVNVAPSRSSKKQGGKGPDHDSSGDNIRRNPSLSSTSSGIDVMISSDDGENSITEELALSNVFYYSVTKSRVDKLLVSLDARVDFATLYLTVWGVLKRCPSVTLRRSKVVVPLFLRFLRLQYYASFTDDPEVPFLHRIGLLTSGGKEEEGSGTGFDGDVAGLRMPELPKAVLRKRLEMFLNVFAAVPSPRQLFQHQLLFHFYTTLLSIPDGVVSKLAFDCMLTYKPPFLVPYKDSVKKLLDDKTIRNELVLFDPAQNNNSSGSNANFAIAGEDSAQGEGSVVTVIDTRFRAELVPLLIRVVYGKFLAKSKSTQAREQSRTRRTAILAFLAHLEKKELRTLFHLMIRGILPSELLRRAVSIQDAERSGSFIAGSMIPVDQSEEVSNSINESDSRRLSILDIATQWQDDVENQLADLTAEDMPNVAWERQLGFLHLLEYAIRVVGHGLDLFVEPLWKLLGIMFAHSQISRGGRLTEEETLDVELQDNDDEEIEEQNVHRTDKHLNQASKVRTLCLHRLAECVHQFHSVFAFSRVGTDLFRSLMPLVTALPHSIAGSDRAPALLSLLHAFASYPETVRLVASHCAVIEAVVKCVASRVQPAAMAMIMEILTVLLAHEKGRALLAHAQLIVASFSKRFAGGKFDVENAELKLAELRIQPSGSVKLELSLLCRIAEGIFSREDVTISAKSTSALSTLLLGMIRAYTSNKKVRVDETWAIDILRIYKSLLWRVADVRPHVAFVSRLFGPASHPQSLFNTSAVRYVLCEVYRVMSDHPSTETVMRVSATAIGSLVAIDRTLLGTRDFERCMPIFEGLSETSVQKKKTGLVSWSLILGPEACAMPREAGLCTAVVHECLRCLYDAELGIRAAALSSLKHLVQESIYWNNSNKLSSSSSSIHEGEGMGVSACWLDILASAVMPGVRSGLRISTDTVKKGFVLLLAHVVKTINSAVAPHSPSCQFFSARSDAFHGDLSVLLHEDAEQDFFDNITHMQLHRRIRVMAKLRASLWSDVENNADPFFEDPKGFPNDDFDEHGVNMVANNGKETQVATRDVSQDTSILVIGSASLVHVFLPLAYHAFLSDEFTKKDHLALMQEGAAFVGAIARKLPWSQYFKVIKTLLKQLEKQKAEKEKVVLTALCAVLDGFHFELSGETEATGLSDFVVEDYRSRSTKRSQDGLGEGEDEEGVDIEFGASESGGRGQPPEVKSNQLGTRGSRGRRMRINDEDVIEEVDVDDDNDEEQLQPNTASAQVQDDQDNRSSLGEEGDTTAEEPVSQLQSHRIARTIVNSVLPWVKTFMLKEGTDRSGRKTKTVRTQVAVALTKLIQRLKPPVISPQRRMGYFTSLVISVIGTLKGRDSSARDAARESLARMVITMGMSSLASVVYEMQHMLTEGYQKHVCNYSLKSLLSVVLVNYSPPDDAPSVSMEALISGEISVEVVRPDFDACLSMIMTNIMEDLNGQTRDDMNAAEEGAHKAVIRESKGSKANETLEICARHLLFRPTYALKATQDAASVSSIHAVTSPLLGALHDCENPELIGRIGEALQRVALGLSHNPSVLAPELLLYLHSTLHPFIVKIARDLLAHKKALGKIIKTGPGANNAHALAAEALEDAAEEDALLGEDLPSYLREDSSDEDEAALYSKKSKTSRGDDVTGYRAATWLPSERRHAVEQRAVIEERNRERAERDKVMDGASAPRLTGMNKYKRSRGPGASSGGSAGGGVDPSAVAAVRFCLYLLQSALKNNRLDSSSMKVRAMILPFLPLLGQCLRLQGSAAVVALATRSLCTILNWGIDVEPLFGRAVANRMLKLLFKGGAILSSDTDLVQACLKGLTSLFQLHAQKVAAAKEKAAAQVMAEKGIQLSDPALKKLVSSTAPVPMPLNEVNLRSLLQLLTMSVMEVTSSYQSTAFQLIKVLVDSKVVLPEIYDLMDKLMEQIVLSQRKGIRESASSVLISFLLGYPLGARRFNNHINQLIANCSYEFEEGRISALDLLATVVRLLPVPELANCAQQVFLPITLRLVNDNSASCRAAAAEVLTQLSRRVDSDLFQTFVGYGWQWLSQAGGKETDALTTQAKSLVRTGALVCGILASARPDSFKKSSRVRETVVAAAAVLTVFVTPSLEYDKSSSFPSQRHRQSSASRAEETAVGDEAVVGPVSLQSSADWAVVYQLLSLLEKLFQVLPSSTDHAFTHISLSEEHSDDGEEAKREPERQVLVMDIVKEALLFPHGWVRACACRLLLLYLSRRDPTAAAKLSTSLDGKEILVQPNALYQLARRLCLLVNVSTMSGRHEGGVINSLVFVIRAMYHNPSLVRLSANELARDDSEDQKRESDTMNEDQDVYDAKEQVPTVLDDDEDYEDQVGAADEADDKEVEEVDEDGVTDIPIEGGTAVSSAANWTMQRLRGIAADPRGRRRIHVMKIFQQLLDANDGGFMSLHLQQMIEVSLRSRLVARGADEALIKETQEMAATLLDGLERVVGSATFIRAFSVVQRRMNKSKAVRKAQFAVEAVANPAAFAVRKMENSRKKKESKKRKNIAFAAIKGLKRRKGPGVGGAKINQ